MVLLQVLPESTLVLAFIGVAIVGFLLFLAVVTYFDHRKEMALIESGAYGETRSDSRAWILGGGLLLLAIGLADIVGTLVQGSVPSDGFFAAFVGVAGLVYYYLKRREDRKRLTPATGASTASTGETKASPTNERVTEVDADEGGATGDESVETDGERSRPVDRDDAVSP